MTAKMPDGSVFISLKETQFALVKFLVAVGLKFGTPASKVHFKIGDRELADLLVALGFKCKCQTPPTQISRLLPPPGFDWSSN